LKRIIRIIKPAGREQVPDFSARLSKLETFGFQVFYDDLPSNASWPYSSASISERAHQLNSCLLNPEPEILLAVRGGYGCSDLLEGLDWEAIRHTPAKTIVGFSDISALISACYTKLNWMGIHAPMIGSQLWDWDSDVLLLLDVLLGKTSVAEFPVQHLNSSAQRNSMAEGELFGGCFSVLTNLIGTGFLPKKLEGKILFLEDIGENPGRLMRFWNQWHQSGLTNGMAGLILGNFTELGANLEDNSSIILQEFASRCPFPVWHTTRFGHKKENLPMPMGSKININHDRAQWKLKENRS